MTRFPATGRYEVNVTRVPVPKLTVVPVVSGNDAAEQALEAVTRLATDSMAFVDAKRFLPIGEMTVDIRSPHRSSGDLATRQGWVELLTEIANLRSSDRKGGYYYGVVHSSWASGTPVAGMAWRPGAISAGVGLGYLFAHELGHNMGLLHVVCSNDSSTDLNYPHDEGLIGSWGYNSQRDVLLDPAKYKDFLACGPRARWISDYHFKKALEFRLKREGRFGGGGTSTSQDGEETIIVDLLPGGER